MNESDLVKLRELTLLLDLAYIHHFGKDPRRANSAEGSIRLEFGTFYHRKNNPPVPPQGPGIETVVIYSSVFSANRICHFDTLDQAIDTVSV